MLIAKLLLILLSLQFPNSSKDHLTGAWENKQGNITTVYIFCDGYFTEAQYTPTKFLMTRGGPYLIKGMHVEIAEEFNTTQKKTEKVSFEFKTGPNQLIIKNTGQEFTRIDDGMAPLAGVWKITKRKQGDELTQIHQTGTRKTLKILSGRRFQ